MYPAGKMVVKLWALFCIFSCASVSGSSEMKQAEKMESALRRLLIDQRQTIEKDASFVYETDVFSGGVVISESGLLVIGKWIINITGKTAKAKIEKRFGGPGQFESEIIEVEFQLYNNSVVITNWRAYQGRGKTE